MSFRHKSHQLIGWTITGLLGITWLLAILAPVGYRADQDWWSPLLIGLTSLLAVGGLGIAWSLLTQWTPRHPRRIALGLWGLLVAVQLLVALSWVAAPRADLAFVHQQAVSLLAGDHHWGAYFQTYPNNVPITLLLAGLMQVGRWVLGHDSGVWLNLIQFAWLDLGVAVCARQLRRRTAARANLFLGLVLVTVPFYAYALNSYSDTAVLPAGLLALAAVAWWRRSGTRLQWVGRSLVLSGLLTITFLFKANFIVLIIATILILWLKPTRLPHRWRASLGTTLLILVCLLGGLAGYHGVQRAAGFTPNPNRTLPAISWVSMSWDPDFHGDYNKWDANEIIQQPTAVAKKDLAQENLTNNLKTMGPVGIGQHLFRKAQLFLATGTFDSFQINSAFTRQPTPYLRHQPQIDWWLANWAQLMYCALLLINGLWGWQQARRRQFSTGFLLGGLFALGLTAFHVVFWETEERYALPLLPLLLAGAAASFYVPDRLPERLADPLRRWGLRAGAGLLGLALLWGAGTMTQPITQSYSVVSQNEGRYYQNHQVTLRLADSLTQPFTATTGFNQLQIDPNNDRIGQVTLLSGNGALLWQSDQQVALNAVDLPAQPAGKYQLTVTNQLATPMQLVTAPATYPVLAQPLVDRPHQYLRFVVNQTTTAPLISPLGYAGFAVSLGLITLGLGTWYRRRWPN